MNRFKTLRAKLTLGLLLIAVPATVGGVNWLNGMGHCNPHKQFCPAPTAPPTVAPTPAPTPTPTPAATAKPATPTPTAPPASSSFLFDEEFNGTSLPTTWGHHWSCCGTVVMDPAMGTVSGGYLHLKTVLSSGQWHATLIDTRDSFTHTYGKYEARIQVTSKLNGLWPAFWLYNGTFGIDGNEIDVVEFRGTESMVAAHETVHKDTQSNQVYAPWANITQFGDAAQWHTYAVDWRSDHIAFSIDGVENWRETTLLPSTQLAVLLNFGMGGWGGTPDPAASGAEMLVDWVHVSN